jgi:hypothetical protein
MAKKFDDTINDMMYKPNERLLVPMNIKKLGGKHDPCYGKLYDLTEDTCKGCGDASSCLIEFNLNMKGMRSKAEKENRYKDLDILLDIETVGKYIKKCKEKGKDKKQIIALLIKKYEITKKEARVAYRRF